MTSPSTSSSPHPLADAAELCRLGVAELTERFGSGALTPAEVARATLERAETIDDAYNAFAFIDRDGALAAAEASAERWRRGEPLSPIDGVPTTIKDIVHVRGWAIRYGSLTIDPVPCAADAPSVERLRDAGAVLIGLTTTPEFGWKAVTDSRVYGVTRNPWAPDCTPGGSSGGAAVAAATGAGVLHLGTDGGGSIRIPASFTGVAGIKPSYGRVAAYPLSGFGTVAHIGPLARTVDDVAAMLTAMAGRDLRDWTQGPGALEPLGPIDEASIEGARIGYWSTPPSGRTDLEVASAVDGAVRSLEALGANIEPIELPGSDLLDLFQCLWFAGAGYRLADIPADRRELIEPGLLEVAEAGRAYSVVDYIRATMRRRVFGAAMDELLTRYDFIVSPATPDAAHAVGEEVPQASGMNRWIEWAGFSYPINLSQQPACVVPCGLTSDGRPVGLQIIGARGADRRALAAARAFEQTQVWGTPG